MGKTARDRTESCLIGLKALQEDREGVSMPACSLFIFSSRGSSRKQLLAKSKIEEFSLAFNDMSTYPCARPKRISEATKLMKRKKEFRKDGFVNYSVFSPPFREVISDLL